MLLLILLFSFYYCDDCPGDAQCEGEGVDCACKSSGNCEEGVDVNICSRMFMCSVVGGSCVYNEVLLDCLEKELTSCDGNCKLVTLEGEEFCVDSNFYITDCAFVEDEEQCRDNIDCEVVNVYYESNNMTLPYCLPINGPDINEPDDPDDADKPDDPDDADNPDKPDDPDDADKPDDPDKPDDRDKPDDPDKPNNPPSDPLPVTFDSCNSFKIETCEHIFFCIVLDEMCIENETYLTCRSKDRCEDGCASVAVGNSTFCFPEDINIDYCLLEYNVNNGNNDCESSTDCQLETITIDDKEYSLCFSKSSRLVIKTMSLIIILLVSFVAIL